MNIRKVLEKMIASRASDLHLKAGTAPIVRVDGVLYTLDDPAPSAQELRDVCNQLLNDEQRLYFSTHNEIEAEVRGKIVKVLVENTQPVEYGQQLFLLEPV